MQKFYQEHGILLETSCIHTPQQNGIVERKHRHLLEIARALRFQASLPIEFWGECVLMATYIINRLPSRSIQNKTPYEILFKSKPSYDHMKVLGCLAYVKENKARKDKFEERGRPCVFVGYPQGKKGYRVFDIQNKGIIVSRDVKFVEGIFPFQNIEDENQNRNHTGSNPFDNTYDNETVAILDTADHAPVVDQPVPNNTSSVSASPQHSLDRMSSTDGSTLSQTSQSDIDPARHPAQNTRPERTRTKPTRLQEFEVELPPSIDHSHSHVNTASSTVHPLSHFVSYKNFTNSHKAYLSAISSQDEPKHFSKAVKNQHLRDAMQR